LSFHKTGRKKSQPSRHIGAYDPRALAVGQAVLRETGAEDVILFGSRARGDYREDSDIDLLLIHPGPLCFDPESGEARDEFKSSAKTKAKNLYGMTVNVQLAWFTAEEFHRMRRSLNHVAAIASEEGINMNGGPAGQQYPDEGDYSEEWGVTSERCCHARIHLQGLSALVQAGQPDLLIGQQAQQTLEHAIKALISATGRRYRHIHDLEELERDSRHADTGFSHPLLSPLRLLSGYAGAEIYSRRPENSLGDHNELYRQVEGDVQRIFRRIAELTGMDPCQEQPS
jgi:hypothetical protein